MTTPSPTPAAPTTPMSEIKRKQCKAATRGINDDDEPSTFYCLNRDGHDGPHTFASYMRPAPSPQPAMSDERLAQLRRWAGDPGSRSALQPDEIRELFREIDRLRAATQQQETP